MQDEYKGDRAAGSDAGRGQMGRVGNCLKLLPFIGETVCVPDLACMVHCFRPQKLSWPSLPTMLLTHFGSTGKLQGSICRSVVDTKSTSWLCRGNQDFGAEARPIWAGGSEGG